MPDSDVTADMQRSTGRVLCRTMIDMQHRAVLHIAAFADDDGVVFRADHHLEPDAHVGFQRDVAHQRRVVRDVMVLAEQRDAPLAEGEDRHAAMIMQ